MQQKLEKVYVIGFSTSRLDLLSNKVARTSSDAIFESIVGFCTRTADWHAPISLNLTVMSMKYIPQTGVSPNYLLLIFAFGFSFEWVTWYLQNGVIFI